jgi:hypothetical protein
MTCSVCLDQFGLIVTEFVLRQLLNHFLSRLFRFILRLSFLPILNITRHLILHQSRNHTLGRIDHELKHHIGNQRQPHEQPSILIKPDIEILIQLLPPIPHLGYEPNIGNKKEPS